MHMYRSLTGFMILLGAIFVVSMMSVLASIQEEVDAADPGDTITVAAGTYKENIYIDKSLTIKGAGAGNTIVDGSQIGSVFIIGDNNVNCDVILSDMTVQNGSAYKGGGICNQAKLAILNATISGNSASWGGGGVFNNRTLTVNDSTISGNKGSRWGAGVYNAGTFKMNHSSIVNNDIRYYGQGGGAYNSGAFIMSDGFIIGNRAHQGSGVKNKKKGNAADWQERVSFTMNRGIISGNRGRSGVYGEESLGGGVQNSEVFIMNGGTISENSADYGGGIYNSGGTFSILGASQIIRNLATSGYGGGIYSGSVTFDGTEAIIKSNQASMPSPSESSWYQGWGVYLGTGTPVLIGGFDPATQVADNMLIGVNYRPNEPATLLGPMYGIIGVPYTYFSTSTDQDGESG